jgi:hypothetical protein
MKLCAIIYLLLLSTIAKSQYFAYLFNEGFYDKNTVISTLVKHIEDGVKLNYISQHSSYQLGDTLVYNISEGGNNTFVLKLTFNKKVKDLMYCNYQQFTFNNIAYFEKYLKRFIYIYGFRYQKKDIYISKYTFKSQMIINQINNNDNFKLIFTEINIPRKEYKALYDTLKVD